MNVFTQTCAIKRVVIAAQDIKNLSLSYCQLVHIKQQAMRHALLAFANQGNFMGLQFGEVANDVRAPSKVAAEQVAQHV